MTLAIAITADPEIPVPPRHYGGIERIIDLLIRGLVQRGHSVTLFANSDSRADCEVVGYPGLRSRAILDTTGNATRVGKVISRGYFDVVHSFGRLAYLLPLLPRGIPKLMSYQRHVSRRSVLWGARLSRGSLEFAACSRSLLKGVDDLGCWHVVHNAVSPEAYTFQPLVPGNAPLVFLGRVEFIKGAHIAIAAAKRSGRDLVIAGNVPDQPEHQRYFESEIRPHVDGRHIRYVGAVDDAQKNELLGSAAALLMPVLWEEPFGIVMAEALACGTPVIGLGRGAVPEVVEDGVSGFVCDGLDEMVQAIDRISVIDRAACRNRMEQCFSGSVMTESYLGIYERMVHGE